MAEQRLVTEQPLRPLVPTERLRAQGVGADVVEAPAAQANSAADVASARRRLADWVRAADPRGIEGSKRPLIVLALTGLVVAWELAAVPVLLFDMTADFGFDLVFIATIGSVIGGIGIILSPAIGYVADRVNRVLMLRVATIVAAAGVILTLSARSLGQLIAARVVAGVGAAFIAGGAMTFPLLCDWYPSRVRTRVFGFLDVAARIATVGGPILTGVLGATFGWRVAMSAFAVVAVVTAIATFFVREPARGYMDRLELTGSEEVAAREQHPVGWAESWRSARSVVTLRRLWYATPFLYVGGVGSLTVLALYFVDVFHLGVAQLGVVAAVGGAFAFFAVILTAPQVDRLLQRHPARVMTYGSIFGFAQAILFVLLVASPSLPLSVAISAIIAAAGSVIGVAMFSVMSLVTPARVRGLGLQIGRLWQLPGLIALPIVVAYAQSLGLRTAFLVFVPLLVVGAILVGSAGAGVAPDIRAARAAALADEEVERARREQRETMLVIRDLDVTYDGTQVLFGVDCDVGAGDIVALLGTNGAGKSTLLRAIVGLQEASNGAIFVDGQDVTHAPPHENTRRGIVMVPGGHAVFPTLTVAENLRTAAGAAGLSDDEARARIEEVLELFPALRERFPQNAGDLSGGEQQMLALGQAFLSRPRLLMIDELSLGLAPAVVEQLVRTVRAIHERGTTVMLVEQSINVALTIAERAIFMEKGEIRFDGPVAELMRRPDLVRAVFMGGALGGTPGRGARALRPVTEREVALRAEDVWVRYGGVEALRGASIDVAAGEIVGIIGPNGAGKTTLFDVIAGHATPAEGRVVLGGVDVTALPPHARALSGLGRSFQDARLFGSLTLRECIALALERRVRVRNPIFAAVWAPRARADERRIARRVEALIRRVGLSAYADKFVHELSTGTRRAVDIACIMAAEPAAVLLDEPSSGLAQAEAEALAPLLTSLVRETGCAMLVIEHDLPLVSSIADRLVAMDLGETIAAGAPADVLADPRVVSSYLAATDEILKRSDLLPVAARPSRRS